MADPVLGLTLLDKAGGRWANLWCVHANGGVSLILSQMRIAYVTARSATDLGEWSGLTRNILDAICNQGVETEVIEHLGSPDSIVQKLKTRFYRRRKKDFALERDGTTLKHWANVVSARLKGLAPVDGVVAPSTLPIARLPATVPTAMWLDATFPTLRASYAYLAGLCRESTRSGERWDRVALQKATMVCYCSEWAANDCLTQYQLEPQKIHVVPFGANCGAPYADCTEAQSTIRARSRSQCELLWVGVEWERKGGPLAVDVVRLLNKSGIPTRLTIAGCEPFAKQQPPEFVECLGFLKRSDEAQCWKLNEVFRRSHFFILPSVAECFGVVLAEASAYGVPSLARDVQGLRTTIKEGNNGWLFPPNASAEPYCEKIRSVWQNNGHYEENALRAYSEWASRLNWRVAGAQFVRLLEKHFLEKQTVTRPNCFSR